MAGRWPLIFLKLQVIIFFLFVLLLISNDLYFLESIENYLFYFIFFNFILFLSFTILYWFCQIFK